MTGKLSSFVIMLPETLCASLRYTARLIMIDGMVIMERRVSIQAMSLFHSLDHQKGVVVCHCVVYVFLSQCFSLFQTPHLSIFKDFTNSVGLLGLLGRIKKKHGKY